MFVQKKDGSVVCADCNTVARSLKEYETEQNANNPDWYWEPWDDSDNYTFVCPSCKNEDFVSDSKK